MQWWCPLIRSIFIVKLHKNPWSMFYFHNHSTEKKTEALRAPVIFLQASASNSVCLNWAHLSCKAADILTTQLMSSLFSSPLPLLFMLCFFYFFLSQYSYLWLKSWIQLFPINIWTKHFLNFFLYIKWKVFWFLYIAWPDSPMLNNYCLLPLVVHVNWRVMCS